MNILVIFGFPLEVGGHYQSALSVLKELKKYDVKFYLMIPENSNEEMIGEFQEICDEFSVEDKIGYSKYIMRPYNTKSIVQICNQKKIDFIFAQDFKALVASMHSSVTTKTPLFFTKAGGALDQYFPPKIIPTIVFSEELYEGLQKRYHLNPERLLYIPERIDCSLYKPSQDLNKDVLSQYKIPHNTGYLIFMAVRFENSKLGYIKAVFEVIKQNYRSLEDIRLIIAGDGSKKQQVLNMIQDLNQYVGENTVQYIGKVFNQLHLSTLYNYVDLVIGSGRGIMEPMACGTNVILAANADKAVWIHEHNFDTIKYWNFSVRAFGVLNEYSDLLSIIKKFKEKKINLEDFNRTIILKHYDAKNGAKKLYEGISNNDNIYLTRIMIIRWFIKYKYSYNLFRLNKHLNMLKLKI